MQQLRIRKHRKAQKLRLADLAEILKVSCPTVHRWELGIIDPSIGDLYRIADALHVSVAELLPEEPVNHVA